MNDKRDLGLVVSPMIEWCARYAGLWAEGEQTNWELYIGDRIVAYNYNVEEGYIIKYLATGSFSHSFKLDVSFNHSKWRFIMTKNFN